MHLKPGLGVRHEGIVGCTPGEDKIVIEYFKLGYGRADPIRMLLHYHDQPYSYVGYTMPEWKEMKEKGYGGEFRKVPRVFVNGGEYQQSMATLRFLGLKYGYYPKGDWKKCMIVDSVLDAYTDCLNSITPLTLKPGDPEEREEEAEAIIEKIHEPLMKFCEQCLKDDRKFLTGGTVTVAEACMVAILVNMWENPESPWKEKFLMFLP